MQRLQPIALALLGDRRVLRVRAVLDRFGLVGGGLLAAGIAFNTLFALIPLALFVSGVIGLVVRDPAIQQAVIEFLAGLAPPLAPFIEQAVGGLAGASASVTIIGLIGAAWGATRLYASIELGIQAMFAGVKARSIVAKTFRRIAFVAVLAALIVAAIAVTTIGSIFGDRLATMGALSVVVSAVLIAVPYLIAAGVVGAIYRVVPPIRPPTAAVWLPALFTGIAIVLITQVFALVAPLLIGANALYGTLGTLFAALAWLNLISTVLLIGAAWVRVRMLSDDEVAATVI
ncbi:MAG TPA: YihY/virulence factor BrkB family protein [Candidatus Limnocylindrales bacterium]|nr:YihY/virulence factor BrkB family protein [Candidatus Limnocylindrales bacterium]